MKDKLDNEVTKIKSKLEEYLSLSNELIRNYERINKGIKSLNKEEDNNNINMIKNLTYISKINKNKKSIINLNLILMKNIKLNFIEDNIKYEEYYFNGIPKPTNIRFDDIYTNGFNISWNIDNLNLLNNIDKHQINYKIKIRKENEKFDTIYEGNNMNCRIDKLNSNTNYEIKICGIYNNNSGMWSEIKNVKTNKIDSIILSESKREDEYLNKIYEWTGGKNMELLYRGTRDGMSGEAFHNKCNNKGPTISIIKSDKGYIFGGYTSINWATYGGYREAPDSFIFTLKNMYEISPTKFKNSKSTYSICDGSDYGPYFGNDIGIRFNSGNYSEFPKYYEDMLGKGKSIFTGDKNKIQLNIKEIEVFKLIK